MLANVVVVIHICYFLFVVCGIIGILAGSNWIRNIWIRNLRPAVAETATGMTGALNFLLRHTIPGSVLHFFYWTAGVFVVASLIWEMRRK